MDRFQKAFVILLASFVSMFSIGSVYANSNVGHNAIGIYCIWKMTTDSSFMPEIQGVDRQELTHPNILNCSGWNDLSNAQKAFLVGMNFPDDLTFMGPSHNEAPMEILSAMYILKDFCPPEFKNESNNTKAFICRMQRYMTWGSKLHIEMDKITHAKLPYAEKEMAKHVKIESIWDAILCREIFENKMGGFRTGSSVDVNKLINLSNCVGPVRTTDIVKIHTQLPLEIREIRDAFREFILGFYGKKGTVPSLSGLKGVIEAGVLKHSKMELKNLLPPDYPYPPLFADELISLANRINLTKGPTEKDIEEQYNIDLPKKMQIEPSFRIRKTERGTTMLKKVKELAK